MIKAANQFLAWIAGHTFGARCTVGFATSSGHEHYELLLSSLSLVFVLPALQQDSVSPMTLCFCFDSRQIARWQYGWLVDYVIYFRDGSTVSFTILNDVGTCRKELEEHLTRWSHGYVVPNMLDSEGVTNKRRYCCVACGNVENYRFDNCPRCRQKHLTQLEKMALSLLCPWLLWSKLRMASVAQSLLLFDLIAIGCLVDTVFGFRMIGVNILPWQVFVFLSLGRVLASLQLWALIRGGAVAKYVLVNREALLSSPCDN